MHRPLSEELLKYVPWKQQREVASDLKQIYQASTVEQAEDALATFAQQWDTLPHH